MVNNRVDKRSKHIGPGGFKCRCCVPYPRDKQRTRRMLRRIAKQHPPDFGLD